jgi:hypothetical protein
MEKSCGPGLGFHGPRVAVVHGGPAAMDGRGAHCKACRAMLQCTKLHRERGEMERAAIGSSLRASPAMGQCG